MNVPPMIQRAALAFKRYQRRWLADRSRYKLMVKARRIGGSAVAAFSAACKGTGYDVFTGQLNPAQGANVHIISASRQQAREMLKRCLEHVRMMEALPDDIDHAVALARKHNLPLTVEVLVAICDDLRKVRPHAGHIVVKARRRAQALRTDGLIVGDPSMDCVRLSNGAELRAYASNPRTIRGGEGHVIFDEFGIAPFGRQIWEAGAFLARPTNAFPHGFTVEVVGTPCGDDNMFFDFAMTDAGRRFSRHRIDVYQAVADGFPLDGTIDDLREECGLVEIFEQEFCCAFLAASTRYISVDLLDAATYSDVMLLKEEFSRHPHTATCGLDVAESARAEADPCALVRNHLVGEPEDDARPNRRQVYWMDPHINRGRGVSFETQEAWMRAELEGTFDLHGRRVSAPPCHRAAIDASGIGRDMAKRLVQRFGDRVLAVDFTPATKEILATRCKRLFEAKPIRQRIPDNAELRRGLLNLQRVIARDGARTLFEMKRSGGKGGGHGDEAWALMLSQHAAEALGGLYVPERGFKSKAIGGS
jgi:phage FluMu gp28-like protein